MSERERERMFTGIAFYIPCRLGKIQSTYIRAHKTSISVGLNEKKKVFEETLKLNSPSRVKFI